MLILYIVFDYIRHVRYVKIHLNERNINYIMKRLCLSRKEAVEYIRTQPLAAKNHRLLTRKIFLSKLSNEQQQHPLTKAYMEDAEIEVMTLGTDIWRVHEFPTFDTRFSRYRIKQ